MEADKQFDNDMHLFVTANGEMLPRWQHAFATISVVASDDLASASPAFVWLRLQAGQSVAEQIQRMRQYVGAATIVVLSDTPNDDEGLEAFSASARGYCNSHATEEVLRQVANVVSQGGLWIGESLMQRLLVGVNRIKPPVVANIGTAVNATVPTWHDKLTEREREVALAVSHGASNKEVARQLGITERTVKAHIAVIFTKLAVQDRLHLALRIRELHIA
jgi:two-component system nitrate/nitrite response regulator NarL